MKRRICFDQTDFKPLLLIGKSFQLLTLTLSNSTGFSCHHGPESLVDMHSMAFETKADRTSEVVDFGEDEDDDEYENHGDDEDSDDEEDDSEQ